MTTIIHIDIVVVLRTLPHVDLYPVSRHPHTVFASCRIVLDEFHESESWQSSVREVMKSLGATHRWGLSGTPPLDETDSVLEVAELLWYADGRPILCEALKNKKKKSLEAKSWWADPANKQKVHESELKLADEMRRVDVVAAYLS